MLDYRIIFLLFLFLLSCGNTEQINPTIDEELSELLIKHGGDLDFFTMPESDDYQNIPQDPKNPLTRSKVELGKLLFHETALAVNPSFPETVRTFSCASCHHAQAGFQANVPQGIGDGGMGFGNRGEFRTFNPNCDKSKIDVQPLRSPSALNITYQTNVLWNGQFGATYVNEGTSHLWTADTPLEVNELGFQGVETQAIAGLSVHRFGLSISKALISSTEYKELFDVSFPELLDEEDRYSKQTGGLAIAAYERTLLANQSGFQKWLKGEENAMTRAQKQGAILFFANNCVNCHTGPALNSMNFYAYGFNDLQNGASVINIDPTSNAHLGRGSFTGISSDNYKFKVPQLYNLKDSPFYGHGSSLTSIRDVVAYKNKGVAENINVPQSQLASDFHPLDLAEYEIDLIVDFIENALYDHELLRYTPTALPSGLCFPNNDALSRVDLGCF